MVFRFCTLVGLPAQDVPAGRRGRVLMAGSILEGAGLDSLDSTDDNMHLRSEMNLLIFAIMYRSAETATVATPRKVRNKMKYIMHSWFDSCRAFSMLKLKRPLHPSRAVVRESLQMRL